MYICPRCNGPLTAETQLQRIRWTCGQCEGLAATFSTLRHVAPAWLLRDLWQSSSDSFSSPSLECPSCSKEMRETLIHAPGVNFPLDVCRSCHLVWFDHLEYEAVVKEHSNGQPRLAEPTLATTDFQRLDHEDAPIIPAEEVVTSTREERHPAPLRFFSWHTLLGLCGLPVEHSGTLAPVRSHPHATFAISGLVVAMSLIAFGSFQGAVDMFALVPADLMRSGGMTILSCFFIHGNIFHLLSNIYFLIIFGDNVEMRLSSSRFTLLILTGHIAGALCHALALPDSRVPMVGASAGISAVIAYYALSFPKAKLSVLILFRWIRCSAAAALVFWIIFQCIGAAQQMVGFHAVSSLAHIGGAAVGVMFWMSGRMNYQSTIQMDAIKRNRH